MLKTTISRMKSLITPPFSFSPMSKKATPLASNFFSLASKPKLFSNLHNPISYFPLKPSMISLPSNFPILTRRVHSKPSLSSSGEIHVIVGPMFAGKTTTLLHRVQAEINDGRLGICVNWEKTLRGLCITGRMNEAVGLLWRSGLEVDHGTYALLLQECIFKKLYNKGKRIHAQMVVVGYVPNEYLKTKLMILYAKSGDLKTMHLLFDMLMEKSLISWNALIAGYVQKGLEEMGLSFYYEMRQNGLTPDQYTFASVFRACATLATLEHGKRAHCVMIKCFQKDNVVVSSALMDMYFKCSSLSDENAGKYVVLSNAYAAFGLWDSVAEVRGVMRDTEINKMPAYSSIEVQGKAHFFLLGDKSHRESEEIYKTIIEMIWILNDAGHNSCSINVALIKSNKDNRYGLDSVVTHDGVKLPCCALPNLSSFKQTFGQDAYDQLDVIGIDEAQFFGDLYDFCREVADHDGKTVIVAGLDGDYLSLPLKFNEGPVDSGINVHRRSFGSVLDIIPLADSVTKLSAQCEICGKRAFFTLRKTEETQTELIGGTDVYMPVCRHHYVSGQVAVEAARMVLQSQKSSSNNHKLLVR
ncbi:hypothetical protein SADUNF_Sadunf16G0014500 [Salix dunnii]|uniref:thymidine kinase n=1 Tax=Salix dunnii TaxID=1413687 RepID=A0A835J8K2_9ROSI|nr:hypothetical protein SADUNF_Sadunf16G0014500 [Salix dunnii]